MSHMIAVLSTEPETMKFPSRVQQMSYTSSMCPLKTSEMKKQEICKQEISEKGGGLSSYNGHKFSTEYQMHSGTVCNVGPSIT